MTITRITFLTSSSVYNSVRGSTDQLSLLMVTEHVMLLKIEQLLLFYRNNSKSISLTKCYGPMRNLFGKYVDRKNAPPRLQNNFDLKYCIPPS